MSEWLKPEKKMTEHRYILAVYENFYGDDEVCVNIDVLHFDGIRNRWCERNGIHRCIMMKHIQKWIPIPEFTL